MNKSARIFFLFFLMLNLWLNVCSCKKNNSAEKIKQSVLENGLSVFVKEDHKVPLVYFEIAVRAGGVTQTRENAGIFHLYEHMMFKGNSLCPTSADFQKRMAGLGVNDWNGTTGEHCVNYYFTIPSDELEEGMRFWSAAIREPNLNEKEFEDEKKVVISEIQAKYANPGFVAGQFFLKNFYPDAPWQLDAGGAVSTVQNASLDMLKEIKEKYYVPNNAALFIGGDVDAEKVFELAEKVWGGWQKSAFDFSSECALQTMEPLSETRYFVFPHPQISPQMAQALVYYRAADADFEREDTYPLDVFTEYIQNPESTFVKELVADQDLRIISEDYVGGGYSTKRRTSALSFYAMLLDSDKALASRVKKFHSSINGLVDGYIQSRKIVPEPRFKKMLVSHRDSNLIQDESAERSLSELRYWWTVCDAEYSFNYEKNFSKVKDADIARVLQKYIQHKNAYVVVYLNPEVYKNCRAEFDEEGFEEITAENAFWF